MQWLFVIFAVLLCIVAVTKKWSWYVDFPQCRAFREQLGETGFVGYHHSMCAFVLVLSLVQLMKG